MKKIIRGLVLTVMAFLTTSLLVGSYSHCERYIIHPEDGVPAYYQNDNVRILS